MILGAFKMSPLDWWVLASATVAIAALLSFRVVGKALRRKMRQFSKRRSHARYENEVRTAQAEMEERLAARTPANEPPKTVLELSAMEEPEPEEIAPEEPPEELEPFDWRAEGVTTEEVWEYARKVPHDYAPDRKRDGEYLAMVCHCAVAGHAEANAKLGEYAARRDNLVEAYYWMSRAKRCGFSEVNRTLVNLRKQWMLNGMPMEYENVTPSFPQALGSVGRALIKMDCGFEIPFARQRLKELADAGVAEAQFMLNRETA